MSIDLCHKIAVENLTKEKMGIKEIFV